MWMNEWEVERMLNRFDEDTNLIHAARVLYRLMRWTNSHSDGWPYWQKPSRAASKLMQTLHDKDLDSRRTGDTEDITEAELKKLFTPIKSFLTRQGVEHSEVLNP